MEAMKCGADDYVLKSNLARLPLAVERELRDSEVRVERNRAEARYRSLVDRVPVGLFLELRLVELGGGGEISDRDYRVHDVPLRGFWSYYAELLGIEPDGAVR